MILCRVRVPPCLDRRDHHQGHCWLRPHKTCGGKETTRHTPTTRFHFHPGISVFACQARTVPHRYCSQWLGGYSLTILFPTPVLPAPPPPAVSTAAVEAPSEPVDLDQVTENTGKFTIGGWYMVIPMPLSVSGTFPLSPSLLAFQLTSLFSQASRLCNLSSHSRWFEPGIFWVP